MYVEEGHLNKYGLLGNAYSTLQLPALGITYDH